MQLIDEWEHVRPKMYTMYHSSHGKRVEQKSLFKGLEKSHETDFLEFSEYLSKMHSFRHSNSSMMHSGDFYLGYFYETSVSDCVCSFCRSTSLPCPPQPQLWCIYISLPFFASVTAVSGENLLHILLNQSAAVAVDSETWQVNWKWVLFHSLFTISQWCVCLGVMSLKSKELKQHLKRVRV